MLTVHFNIIRQSSEVQLFLRTYPPHRTETLFQEIKLSILLFLRLWQPLSDLLLLWALIFNTLFHMLKFCSICPSVAAIFIYWQDLRFVHLSYCVISIILSLDCFIASMNQNYWSDLWSAHIFYWLFLGCCEWPMVKRWRVPSKIKIWVLTNKFTVVTLFCLQVIEKACFYTKLNIHILIWICIFQ